MFYVVRNTPVYHLTASDAPEGTASCGSTYDAASTSVVHEEPQEGFRLCKLCEKAVSNG
jgi:hypothetical protein